jgi:hypothetical protein
MTRVGSGHRIGPLVLQHGKRQIALAAIHPLIGDAPCPALLMAPPRRAVGFPPFLNAGIILGTGLTAGWTAPGQGRIMAQRPIWRGHLSLAFVACSVARAAPTSKVTDQSIRARGSVKFRPKLPAGIGGKPAEELGIGENRPFRVGM